MFSQKILQRNCVVFLSLGFLFLSCTKKQPPKTEETKETREVTYKDPNVIENLKIPYLKII